MPKHAGAKKSCRLQRKRHDDQRLATAIKSSQKYNPAIRAACELAKITLNKYYSLSDASKLYRIAISTYHACVYASLCIY